MADTSTYPATLDGDLRALVPAGSTPSGFEDFCQLVADAVAKIETELGTDPSGAVATVAAAIAAKASLAGATFTGAVAVPDAAYDATTWNGSVEVPTKNAVRDKIESLGSLGTEVELSPTSDTYIDQQNTAVNSDTAATLWVGEPWTATSWSRAALLTFDISSLPDEVDSADLVLEVAATTNSWDSLARGLSVRRLRRAYVPAEVTWANWSTGNAWTTAGARSTVSDIYPEVYGHTAVNGLYVGSRVHLDLRRLVETSKAAAENTLRVIIGSHITSTSLNPVQFHSLEASDATKGPLLVVRY